MENLRTGIYHGNQQDNPTHHPKIKTLILNGGDRFHQINNYSTNKDPNEQTEMEIVLGREEGGAKNIDRIRRNDGGKTPALTS